MKRLLPLLLILPLAGFRPAPIPPPVYEGGPVRMALVDRDRGTELRSYPAEGQRWVAGERGHRYAVRLYNDSPRRVLVVLSVDGVNAISGEDADPSQTGYVLNPGQRADITGWRKSQDEVAQFVFSSPSGSYASRTGRPDNIGVPQQPMAPNMRAPNMGRMPVAPGGHPAMPSTPWMGAQPPSGVTRAPGGAPPATPWSPPHAAAPPAPASPPPAPAAPPPVHMAPPAPAMPPPAPAPPMHAVPATPWHR